jgi:hypothetical protein
MPRRSLIVLVVLLGIGSIRAAAQEAHPPQAADPGRPTHGIIRKPQPKPPAEPAKAATTSEPGKADAAKPEPGKAAEHAKPTPAASTEAVAAAIANAVRSLEEKEKKKPEAAHPHSQPARPVRSAAPRPVPQRRYSVTWPSQRFEVQWEAPGDRVMLSWGALETTAERSHDDLRLEP